MSSHEPGCWCWSDPTKCALHNSRLASPVEPLSIVTGSAEGSHPTAAAAAGAESTAALTSRLASPMEAEPSPVLAFHEWVTRYTADRGKPLTQDEYFAAQAGFYAAHPGEGPTSTPQAPAEAESPQSFKRAQEKSYTLAFNLSLTDHQREEIESALLEFSLDNALLSEPMKSQLHIERLQASLAESKRKLAALTAAVKLPPGPAREAAIEAATVDLVDAPAPPQDVSEDHVFIPSDKNPLECACPECKPSKS